MTRLDPDDSGPKTCAGKPAPAGPAASVKFLVSPPPDQPITSIQLRPSGGSRCRPPGVSGANLSASGQIESWFTLSPFTKTSDYPSIRVKAGAKRVSIRGTKGWILGDPASADEPATWDLTWLEHGFVQTWQSSGLARQIVIRMINDARPEPADTDLLVPPRSSTDLTTITGARSTAGADWYVHYGNEPGDLTLVVDGWGPIDGPPFEFMPERDAQMVIAGNHTILFGKQAFETFTPDNDPEQVVVDVARWTDDQGRLFDVSGRISLSQLSSIVEHLTPLS